MSNLLYTLVYLNIFSQLPVDDFLQRSTFVSSAWSFVFSSPPQQPMTSDFEGFSIPDFIHNIYIPILNLEKEPVFPFLMFSAKQGNYLVPFL